MYGERIQDGAVKITVPSNKIMLAEEMSMGDKDKPEFDYYFFNMVTGKTHRIFKGQYKKLSEILGGQEV